MARHCNGDATSRRSATFTSTSHSASLRCAMATMLTSGPFACETYCSCNLGATRHHSGGTHIRRIATVTIGQQRQSEYRESDSEENGED
ncbi:Hypothetical predicted protein [Olea europaea subsp. europaea]|uniref:Uncharacterized protein n=1 Tax=Olea europaea subsp. europaea TaxID=158383 RepID=A0A8S0QZI6_OLEEU|nr:Hypothetical predicted protein [Olea europaea subsp. europaea]